MTSTNKSAVMAELERVGAQGATIEQLQSISGASLNEVRILVKNRVGNKLLSPVLPAGTRPQVYVLTKHLPAYQAALSAQTPNLPQPTQSLAKMTKTGSTGKPAKVAAPKAPKESRHCSGTVAAMDHGYLPRMECARPGADAHAAIPSRRGSDLVPHQRPIHMCSTLRGGLQ